VVRGPQVVLGFCPCGPLRLNISPKKDRKNKINVNCVSHTIVENLKQFAFKGDKSRVVRKTFWLIKVVPAWKKFGKRCSNANEHQSQKFLFKVCPCVDVTMLRWIIEHTGTNPEQHRHRCLFASEQQLASQSIWIHVICSKLQKLYHVIYVTHKFIFMSAHL
jgi:hypothetical protein